VAILEGRWIDRTPRRDEVCGWLLAEAELLPRLAPLLPLDVPVPAVVADDPLRVRHPIVAGEPVPGEASQSDGQRLGAFLRALHDAPLSLINGTGVRDAAASGAEAEHVLDCFQHDVMPRLPSSLRDQAGGCSTACSTPRGRASCMVTSGERMCCVIPARSQA
ncbi:MAG: hypothetical protein L0K86_17390, partial [Actinomycetia bacterium]|nr:hypothetical protein [Actinomycetes bacterium]